MFSGTGIVTSVPSDAPDDYAALRDLKKKAVSDIVCSVKLLLGVCLSISLCVRRTLRHSDRNSTLKTRWFYLLIL